MSIGWSMLVAAITAPLAAVASFRMWLAAQREQRLAAEAALAAREERLARLEHDMEATRARVNAIFAAKSAR